MRIKSLRAALLLAGTVLIAGCGSDSVINRIRVLVAVGFDREGEMCTGVVAYPNYIHRKGSLAIMKGSGREPKLIMEQFQRQSPRKIRYNKVDSIILSRQIASEGVTVAVNSIERDPALGSNVLLAVSSCSAESIIRSLDRQELENTPFNLVRQNVSDGAVPLSNLYFFLHDFYSEGKDPSMPSLALDKQNQIFIDGYALFKKDRLKLVLNLEEMALFKMLQGKPKIEQLFTYKGEHYVLTVRHGRTRSVPHPGTSPKSMRYDVRLTGSIRNYKGNLLARLPDESRAFAEAIESQIKNKLLALLKKMQAGKLDSLGVGERFRSVERDWQAAAFYREDYPTMDFQVNVVVNITNSGAGE
ncbi:Ger(x)C family spore germination C-terminal domain-containing protein [Paenibacillus sacheonensis]|uniref:Ger(X)C family spore germination protein n=1 Tax=Paenibacillus sacheonensis TaxID=742054 RepID=A0A7X4YQ32_9BACL|nr:Ger(x)C family spore germination C-terminal domain-containing protein [Paenibacillus sacheonensis]MBM7566259.1 Ger(x)C family germination protein [Paenibacillus sacheonensis]NBC70466.1 hypothetical protein [Paenibacillus sacheonensis]